MVRVGSQAGLRCPTVGKPGYEEGNALFERTVVSLRIFGKRCNERIGINGELVQIRNVCRGKRAADYRKRF